MTRNPLDSEPNFRNSTLRRRKKAAEQTLFFHCRTECPASVNGRMGRQAIVSLLQRTDVYQGTNKETDREHSEYRFALALICIALALVIASVMFPELLHRAANFHSSVLNGTDAGCKQTVTAGSAMSALPPKADIDGRQLDVR
jgi:hypothetical protein